MSASEWKYCPIDGTPFTTGGRKCLVCGKTREASSFHRITKPTSALLPSLSDAAVGTPPRSSLGHTRVRSTGEIAPADKPWRKILYEPQPYEDNYVPDSFLALLRTNIHHRSYSFLETMQDTAAIVQQISIVTLFLIVFIHSLENGLPVSFLIVVDLVLAMCGFISMRNVQGSQYLRYVIILICLIMFSPVLRTLTRSFSTDTIYASSVMLVVIHLFFHDYGYVNGTTDRFSGQLSLNAAISASVLLASRLPSDEHVFALITLAIELFALSPYFRHNMKKYSIETHYFASLLVIIITLGLLIPLSRAVSLIYLAVVIGVSFVGPWGLLRIQKYKSAIHGPWEEATVPKS